MPRSELERLRVLQRLHHAFHSSLDLDELLPRVLGDAVEALEAEAGSLWLMDDAAGELVCRTATGPVGGRLEGIAVPLGAGIIGSVAATKRPEVVEDTTKDRRFLFQVDQQTGFVTRSVLCAPLLLGGRCLGAIQVLNCRAPGAFFQREDLEFLESIAGDAAQALDNARLFAAEQRAQDLATLLSLARELTATLNTQELLERLAQSAAALTGCDRAAVVLVAPQGDSVRISASAGAPDDGLPGRVRALSRSAEERYVPDLRAETEPPFAATEACRSFLALPLRDADGAVGLLYLESGRERAFSPRRREGATILAQQATVAIRNALLYNQVPLLNAGGRLRGAWLGLLGGKTGVRRPWVAAALLLVPAVALVPWSYRVGGKLQVRPSERAEITAPTPGTLQQVLVREGQAVQPGQVLARLDEQGPGAAIRSPIAGVVLTPRLEERAGELVDRGTPLCVVGALDPVEVEIMVPEDRAPEVRPGQTVLFKLSALPGRPFRTRVARVAAAAVRQPGGAFFPVACAVANPDGGLRPGQEGWAKIGVGTRPLGFVLLKRGWDWVRMTWWRLW